MAGNLGARGRSFKVGACQGRRSWQAGCASRVGSRRFVRRRRRVAPTIIRRAGGRIRICAVVRSPANGRRRRAEPTIPQPGDRAAKAAGADVGGVEPDDRGVDDGSGECPTRPPRWRRSRHRPPRRARRRERRPTAANHRAALNRRVSGEEHPAAGRAAGGQCGAGWRGAAGHCEPPDSRQRPRRRRAVRHRAGQHTAATDPVVGRGRPTGGQWPVAAAADARTAASGHRARPAPVVPITATPPLAAPPRPAGRKSISTGSSGAARSGAGAGQSAGR